MFNIKISPHLFIVLTEGVFGFSLQELHKNIVNQYKRYYKLHVPVLSQEDCMYWYNFLAYHMAGANMQKVSSDWVHLFLFTHCPSPPGHFFLLELSFPRPLGRWANTEHKVLSGLH